MQIRRKILSRPLTEHEIIVLALRSGMRADQINELLDTIERWRKLGLEKPTDFYT
jgi:hypothetical protein